MTGPLPLNPADHVLLVMDREIRAAGLPGAWCGFALELDGPPDADRLQAGLDALTGAFPVLSARLVARGRRYAWQLTGHPIPLTRHPCPAGENEADFWHDRTLALMNSAPDAFTGPPLSFHWLAGEHRHLLMARWLHPLMDAGGVKRLFDFVMTDPTRRRRYLQGEAALVTRKLAAWSWRRRLQLLWRGKRHNDWIDRLGSSLPAASRSATRRRLNAVTLTLSREASRSVERATLRHTGLGARSLYLVGCLMRALEAMGPALRRDAWCIPYAFNLRPGNAPVPVTGNQVSVLFAQAPHAVVADRSGLFGHLRRQHADTVRRELDQAYLPLMWLGRWLSLEHYGRILRRQKSGGERSSAWFSDVGDIRFPGPDFLGAPITGVRHTCFVTTPPSLAVLFSCFDGRLGAAINYLEPDLDPAWIGRFRAHLRTELLAE